jgi:hypothetical protein
MKTVVTSATEEQPQKTKSDMKKVFPLPPAEDQSPQDSAFVAMPVTTQVLSEARSTKASAPAHCGLDQPAHSDTGDRGTWLLIGIEWGGAPFTHHFRYRAKLFDTKLSRHLSQTR